MEQVRTANIPNDLAVLGVDAIDVWLFVYPVRHLKIG
jgi:hypothetical protein